MGARHRVRLARSRDRQRRPCGAAQLHRRVRRAALPESHRHAAPVTSESRVQPWNKQLATVGMELIGRRRKAVASLQTELARVYGALSGARTKVEIRYRTSLGEATDPAVLLAAHRHPARALAADASRRDDRASRAPGGDRAPAARGDAPAPDAGRPAP